MYSAYSRAARRARVLEAAVNKSLRVAGLALALVAAGVLSGCELLTPTIDPSKTPSVTGTATASGAAAADETRTPPARVLKQKVYGNPIHIYGGVAYPGRITINVDATVTWVNHDDTTYQVWGNDFRSTAIPPGGQYSRRFFTPGIYAWRGMAHPVLGGEIVVR